MIDMIVRSLTCHPKHMRNTARDEMILNAAERAYLHSSVGATELLKPSFIAAIVLPFDHLLNHPRCHSRCRYHQCYHHSRPHL